MGKVIDAALRPLAWGAGYALKGLARIDQRFPRSREMLDRSGLSLVRRHYYTPMLDEADLHRSLEAERSIPGLDLNEAGQLALLAQFRFADELRALPLQKTGEGYHYLNGAYEYGDGEMLYNMIRHFRPRRIVEVGSGHSTLMAQEALRANRAADPAYVCRMICIEPYNMPWLDRLDVDLIRERVELVDRAVFAELGAGDILFIDSSHVIRPQGDVVTELLEIVPSLAPGVLVHVHDVFTPFDYPRQWVVEERRLWDEQYMLEAFLSFNDEFEVIAAVNWLAQRHRDRLAEAMPVLHANPGHAPGAFWFRRKG